MISLTALLAAILLGIGIGMRVRRPAVPPRRRIFENISPAAPEQRLAAQLRAGER